MFDFTDSANPVEIAFFDRGPVDGEKLISGGYWSSYYYNGFIYAAEIARGIDVLRMVPSEHLTAERARRGVAGALGGVQLAEPAQGDLAHVDGRCARVSRSVVAQQGRHRARAAPFRRRWTARIVSRQRDRGAAAAVTDLTALAADLERDAGAATGRDAARMRALAETAQGSRRAAALNTGVGGGRTSHGGGHRPTLAPGSRPSGPSASRQGALCCVSRPRPRPLALAGLASALPTAQVTQQPAEVDIRAVGPQVGSAVPAVLGRRPVRPDPLPRVVARGRRARCSSSFAPPTGDRTARRSSWSCKAATEDITTPGARPRGDQLRPARHAEEVRRLARNHVPAALRHRVGDHQPLRPVQRDRGPEDRGSTAYRTRARSSSTPGASSSRGSSRTRIRSATRRPTILASRGVDPGPAR